MTDNTVLNAVIGAVVTVVLSFTGFSPIIGGAVAAYLEESDKDGSIRVGALSGLIAVLPLSPLLLLGLAIAPFDMGFSFLLIVVFVGFIAAISVGLSALGGFLAHYLMDNRRDVQPTEIGR